MEELVARWGYWIVFAGSLFEGESVILTASVFAAKGVLSLYKVMLVAFIGTLVADQALFHIGYYHGHKILKIFPKLQQPSKRAFALLHRYDTWFILTFRFIWGIRTISPLVIGTARVNFKRFSLLNLVAAAVWSGVSCSAGYFFGGIIVRYMGSWQFFGLVSILAVVGIVWGLWMWQRKKNFSQKG